MKRAASENIEKALRRQSSGRFLDLHNQPKPKWRDALMALAARDKEGPLSPGRVPFGLADR